MDALRNVLTQLETKGAALGHFNIADFPLFMAGRFSNRDR
jgi:hypothetical protein